MERNGHYSSALLAYVQAVIAVVIHKLVDTLELLLFLLQGRRMHLRFEVPVICNMFIGSEGLFKDVTL